MILINEGKVLDQLCFNLVEADSYGDADEIVGAAIAHQLYAQMLGLA